MKSSTATNIIVADVRRIFQIEMKCHCKFCLPRFFCQTLSENDLCYYRYSLQRNGSDDFGCVQSDVTKFFCNTTDVNYRTECCSTFFCNMHYRLFNQSTPSISVQSRQPNLINSTIVLTTIVTLLCLISFVYYFYSRKYRRMNSVDDRTFTKDSSPFDTVSCHSEILNENLPLETRRINKELTFLGQLGQGRHARVRLALLGRQYRAIKMFEPRFESEFERERTIFETDLLQHPNILGFFGADFFSKETETCHILIFEWHPYGTLYDVLKDNSTEVSLNIERVLQYSISLADGLAHLHSIKYGTEDICKPQMAHCDMKSSNILVKLNGDCCLSDFSLAVRCDPQTQQIFGGGIERLYHRVGTKLYMPPELLDQKCTFHFDRIGAYQRADVYSLALVLWEIGFTYLTRTHRRPYENQLPMNFTLDHLVQLVCREHKRPTDGPNLSISDQIVLAFINLLDFYWCDDPCARHSAANLQDQLRQLRSNHFNL